MISIFKFKNSLFWIVKINLMGSLSPDLQKRNIRSPSDRDQSFLSNQTDKISIKKLQITEIELSKRCLNKKIWYFFIWAFFYVYYLDKWIHSNSQGFHQLSKTENEFDSRKKSKRKKWYVQGIERNSLWREYTTRNFEKWIHVLNLWSNCEFMYIFKLL